MSLKTWLMPALSQRFLSRERLLRQRAAAERQRRARGEPHRILYFHQPDDPYSALAAQALAGLLARYDIALDAHIVSPPADAVAPARAELIAYSRRDAALLARRFGLKFTDHRAQPAPAAVERATALLVAAAGEGQFAARAADISVALWDAPASLPDAQSGAATASHVQAADQLRKRLGHYLGATFYYGGEWYWGIDRLYHLEQRLQDLGAAHAGVSGALFPPPSELQQPFDNAAVAPIDFFVSLRSPYSAIVTPRVFELARQSGAPLRLRYVLPMVMRGLPVPREKRLYISRDTAREAHVRGIPFGRLNDPVGRPTERGLSLMPLAEREGRAREYLQSFMQGVWSEGIDAGSARGLRRIVERAGLSWDAAQPALRDDSWRAVAEQNRADMFRLGLWGVPSFQVRDVAVWGQDRLWAVEEALRRA